MACMGKNVQQQVIEPQNIVEADSADTATDDDGRDDEEDVFNQHRHPSQIHDALLEGGDGKWYAEAESDEHIVEEKDIAVAPLKLDLPASDAASGEARPSEARPSEAGSEPGGLKRTDSKRSLYGTATQVSGEAAHALCPPPEAGQAGGLVWHAQLLADNYNPKRGTLPDGTLKARRPMPQARARDFFSSLVRTPDGRQIFTGTLNGWPALTNLELRSITLRARSRVGHVHIRRLWNAGDEAEPAFPDNVKVTGVRATLRAPPWSALGYSAGSPGYVFWAEWADSRSDHGFRNLRLHHGENILRRIREDGVAPARAVRVHHFAHRRRPRSARTRALPAPHLQLARGPPVLRSYAMRFEGPKDKITWHCAVLIEWDHGRHTTVAELAWMGGLGGYNGRSNFYSDRDAKRTMLYDSLPPCLKGPWRPDLTEARHPRRHHTSASRAALASAS